MKSFTVSVLYCNLLKCWGRVDCFLIPSSMRMCVCVSVCQCFSLFWWWIIFPVALEMRMGLESRSIHQRRGPLEKDLPRGWWKQQFHLRCTLFASICAVCLHSSSVALLSLLFLPRFSSLRVAGWRVECRCHRLLRRLRIPLAGRIPLPPPTPTHLHGAGASHWRSQSGLNLFLSGFLFVSPAIDFIDLIASSLIWYRCVIRCVHSAADSTLDQDSLI